MTAIGDLFNKIFSAVMPSQEGNAWDELKRARAMEVRRTPEAEAPAMNSRPSYSTRFKY